mmetsp:Transcript_25934/g.85381  ORF Transcript_25934/g.85381 Transcript_25934/m.85381 type:complete len:94 (-) Transcript_25934:3457-3738(-)
MARHSWSTTQYEATTQFDPAIKKPRGHATVEMSGELDRELGSGRLLCKLVRALKEADDDLLPVDWMPARLLYTLEAPKQISCLLQELLRLPWG